MAEYNKGIVQYTQYEEPKSTNTNPPRVGDIWFNKNTSKLYIYLSNSTWALL